MNLSDVPQPDSPFAEPWQARVFALTVAMNEAGHFAWTDWAAVFGRHLQGTRDGAGDYWRAWAAALEEMLTQAGIADDAGVAALAERWQAAAHATPHGQPINLENADR
ncbi:MAG: nitrile hydratase accessory protein [Pararhodobacter sp.]|nr:nitrile hydratase accessory protein [Pararhodobacter sp.]